MKINQLAGMPGLALAAWSASLILGQNPPTAQPLGPMRKDASPAFDVATIKPSDPTASGSGFKLSNRRVFAVRENLRDLITFAYGLHPSQVLDAPAWADTDYFDVNGQPDEPSIPDLEQMRNMYRKLLSDRFRFSCHRAQRELPVYVIAVGKNGPKLAPSQRGPNAATDQTMRRPGYLTETNATMAEFAGMLQVAVLDRPVLDRTGLAGRFDFTLMWTPDEFQPSGGVKPASQADAPPSFPTALQEQLGLKLDATKASADVLIIDKVEKPSEN
jgi:uncharacterized protein (TIGR03435 family)